LRGGQFDRQCKGVRREMMMKARNPHESHDFLATGIRAVTVLVVVGTLAAVWRPLAGYPMPEALANAATEAAATADMSVYFPSRFAKPEKVELRAPTI
jgi:hypothetical protein